MDLLGQKPAKPNAAGLFGDGRQTANTASPAPVSTTMPVGGAPSVAPGGSTAPPNLTPQASSPVQPSVFQGFTPKHAMEGFDFNREQNPGKSAKDAFAYLSNQAPPPPINDKAALGQWFNQYIRPGMNALGHNADEAQGDKFRFKNWQGQFDVDFGRGAGADGGALAWQVDDGTAQMGSGPYVPKAAGLIPLMQQPQQEGEDALAKIQKEIEALQQGGASPLDQDALASLLV